MKKSCIECNSFLPSNVFNYSLENFGVPLCRNHQNFIRNKKTTPETLKLYFALRMLGVPAELEKFDGYKTIDIAVVEAKVNIEVDGMQHKYNSRQALADLKRTYYSFKKGYITLRIPNTLINWNVNETAKYIFNFLNESEERNWEENELIQEDWNDIFDVEDLEDFEHD